MGHLTIDNWQLTIGQLGAIGTIGVNMAPFADDRHWDNLSTISNWTIHNRHLGAIGSIRVNELAPFEDEPLRLPSAAQLVGTVQHNVVHRPFNCKSIVIVNQ